MSAGGRDTTLAIATYNIHAFKDASLAALSETIRASRADVIGLQEVTIQDGSPSLVHMLGELCGLPHVAHHSSGSFLTNSILSRYPIKRSEVIVLAECGEVQEPRFACLAEVDLEPALGVPDEALQVCCLHLDHIDEGTRASQWAGLHKKLQEHAWFNPQRPHVVVGDFNSLHRPDYDEATWARIRADRRQWEPPMQTLMDSVLHGGELAGLLDSPRDITGYTHPLAAGALASARRDIAVSTAAARRPRYLDSRAVSLGSGAAEAPLDTTQESTCAFRTRIDFILIGDGSHWGGEAHRPSPRPSVQVVPGSYRLKQADTSDHALVLVELRVASQAGTTGRAVAAARGGAAD